MLALAGCEKPCASDAECPLPAVCSAQKTCAVPAPRADKEPCSDDRHCQGGVCLSGACATGCDSTTACASGRCAPAADSRSSSLRLVCGDAAGERFLSERCQSDEQCRSGVCQDGHCSAVCGTCPEPLACRPAMLMRAGQSLATGVCTWWPVQPVLELGSVDTPVSGVAALSFTVPEGYGAFTVVLEDFGDRVPVVMGLTAPDGTKLIGQPRLADGGWLDLSRSSSAIGTATALVPQSDDPRAVARAGTYQLEVASFEPMGFPTTRTQVAARLDRVAVVLKKPVYGGSVDVTVHVAPETGYSTDGGTMTFVRQMLEAFDALGRDKMGLTLGEVHLRSLPPDAGGVLDTSAKNRELWRAQADDVRGERPINLMFVGDITFAAGVSGGTPGPPGVYLRPSSGVSVEPLASGPQPTGVLIGHELGHFMGLSHSTDSFFGPDLIDDTPACADLAGGACPDDRNLMYPSFPTREPLVVTPGQVKVLSGSPWIYRRVHPLACDTREVVALGRGAFGSDTSYALGSAPQMHLLRLEQAATRLEAAVAGNGFTPNVTVRRGACDAAAVASNSDGGVAARVDSPAAGAYFVLVDGSADGGTFELAVTVTP